MGIIEEFYRGNITPAEVTIPKSSAAAKALNELTEAEKLMRENSDPKLLDTLGRLIDAQIEFNAVTASDSYVKGFRAGAKFILDIFSESS